MDPGYFYFGLKFLKLLQNILDAFLYLLFGYTTQNGHEHERRLAHLDFRQSAQLVKIRLKSQYHFAGMPTLKNFIYTHERYIDPKFILENDHVTIMGCNEDLVWFCVSDPHVDVLDMNLSPFNHTCQYEMARYLILLRHDLLVRLASDEVVKDEHKHGMEIIISNSARCGSTLLCKMLERVPNTRVISEPWVLVYVHEMYVMRKMSRKHMEELIKSILPVLMKKARKREDHRIIIKLPMYNCPQVSIIKRVCPNIRHIYNTRHPKDSTCSLAKASELFENGLYWKYEGNHFWFYNIALPYTPLHDVIRQKYIEKRFHCSKELKVALSFAGCFCSYVQHKEIFERVIFYEDLIENPTRVMLDLFGKFVIPHQHVQATLQGLDGDSQHMLFNKGAERSTDMYKNFLDVEKIDRVFEECGTPLKFNMSLEDYKDLFQ